MTDGVERFKDDLMSAGREHPQLLIAKLEHVGLNKLELNIMKLRYVDGMLIKQIPDATNKSERWVKSVHSLAIIKTLDGLKVADLVELGMHHDTTSRALYQQ